MTVYYQDEALTLYNGNCVDILASLLAESIDLTVTSPPYDALRKYQGYSFEFESVAQDLLRVTKNGGVVIWVVGDSTVNGSESGTSFRQALYFKEIDFNLHDTMIYAKKTPIPLTHNRYEQQFEYMFVFSKGKPKTFNPLLEKCTSAGDKNDMTHRRLSDGLSKSSGFGKPHKETRYRYNIWYFHKENSGCQHPAMFPEQLAEDHIRSWSNEDDVVLDPMCGSGTTLKKALQLNRKAVGIDISEEYCAMSLARCGKTRPEDITLTADIVQLGTPTA